MSALQASIALQQGLELASTQFDIMIAPMSDGGEGLLDCMQNSQKMWKSGYVSVVDSYGHTIQGRYLYHHKTAIIEMAQVCGLALIPEEKRKVLYASTFGFGELFKEVLQRGMDTIYIGIGGSATNDGGIGFLQALGVRFFDAKGALIPAQASGVHLREIASLETHSMLKTHNCNIITLCDVKNPLLGKNGATFVYGKQKGADTNDLEILEKGMQNFSSHTEKHFGKKMAHLEGMGAAGGMGFALHAFLQAQIHSGISSVIHLIRLEEVIQKVDLVIVGEGMLDYQSSFGKAPVGVATLAGTFNKPVIGIAGSLGEGYEKLHTHIQAMFSLIPAPMNVEEAMKNAQQLMIHLGREIGGLLALKIQ